MQLFNLTEQTPLIGVIGQLQFDVFIYRLEDEYGAPVRLEPLPFECSRWISKDDAEKAEKSEKLLVNSEKTVETKTNNYQPTTNNFFPNLCFDEISTYNEFRLYRQFLCC